MLKQYPLWNATLHVMCKVSAPGSGSMPCCSGVSAAERHFQCPQISRACGTPPHLPPHTQPWQTGTSRRESPDLMPAPAYTPTTEAALELWRRQSQNLWGLPTHEWPNKSFHCSELHLRWPALCVSSSSNKLSLRHQIPLELTEGDSLCEFNSQSLAFHKEHHQLSSQTRLPHAFCLTCVLCVMVMRWTPAYNAGSAIQ